MVGSQVSRCKGAGRVFQWKCCHEHADPHSSSACWGRGADGGGTAQLGLRQAPATRLGDGRNADAPRLDDGAGLLKQQRPDGAGVVRLQRRDAAAAAQVVLVGDQRQRALRGRGVQLILDRNAAKTREKSIG